MKLEIKYVDENKTFYVVSVETPNCTFSLTYKYSPEFDAWGLLEPTNNRGYKIFTLKPEFKSAVKNELMKILNK